MRLLALFAGIFIACSLVLWWYIPNQQAHFEIDSPLYQRIALRYATHNQLADPEAPGDVPSHPMGYPFLVGWIYKLAGVRLDFVVLIQVLLCLIAGWLLYQSALRLWGFHVALIAAAMCSVNIGFLTYSQLLLTDILLVVLLTAFINRFITFITTESLMALCQAGLLLGLSISVRPAAVFYIPCLLVILGISGCKAPRATLMILFMCAFSCYAPVAGYLAFNKVMFNYSGISPLVHENLYCYFLPRVVAKIQRSSVHQVQKEISEVCAGIPFGNQRRWQKLEKIFNDVVVQHPFKIVHVWFENVVRSLVGLYSTQMKVLFNPAIKGGSCSFFAMHGNFFERAFSYISYGSCSWLLTFIAFGEALWIIIEYIGVLIALLSLLRTKQYRLASFFITYITYFMLITGHDGCGRYRLMIEPVLIVAAALGIVIVITAIGSYRKGVYGTKQIVSFYSNL